MLLLAGCLTLVGTPVLVVSQFSQEREIRSKEDALKIASDARDGAHRVMFMRMAYAGEVIIKLPGWQSGNVPNYDSSWSTATLSAALGRSLTVGEQEIQAELSVQPYRIYTNPLFLGVARSSLQSTDKVFLIAGTLHSSVGNPFLDKEALPVLDFVPSPSFSKEDEIPLR